MEIRWQLGGNGTAEWRSFRMQMHRQLCQRVTPELWVAANGGARRYRTVGSNKIWACSDKRRHFAPNIHVQRVEFIVVDREDDSEALACVSSRRLTMSSVLHYAKSKVNSVSREQFRRQHHVICLNFCIPPFVQQIDHAGCGQCE